MGFMVSGSGFRLQGVGSTELGYLPFVYHPTLGWRVIKTKTKKKGTFPLAEMARCLTDPGFGFQGFGFRGFGFRIQGSGPRVSTVT